MQLFNVLSVEEIKEVINKSLRISTCYESINILESVNRISFEDITAGSNVPEFRRSTVDGYAVNSKDVFGAGEAIPSILTLKGEVSMGKEPPANIKSRGECLYVPTGGMLPEGADSVIMIEYSDRLDENTVLVYTPAAPGDNVIQRGEDISTEDIVIRKGQKLRPYEIGVLASLGIHEIKVYKKIRAAIISTGDEIVPCESQPALGEVRDINTYLLWSQLMQDGAEPVRYGIIKDDYDLLKATVDKALEECDFVLISGGSSVGKKDQTLKVIDSYEDGEILAHGLAVKPGKPTIIGRKGEKIIFGLPGHPLACSIVYKIIVKDYLSGLMSNTENGYGINALMSINYHKAKGREEYLPVSLETIDGKIIAKPVFGKSGLITTFSRAWGYIKIDRNLEGLKEGQDVNVIKF